MEYQIKLDRFEGPYSKLLELIEERKLSITEVSLARIAEEYIAYVQALSKKDYQDLSQFIVVAATLMLIKVKSLLPGITFTEDEEKQVKGLEKKLMLHALLRDASKGITTNWGKHPLFLKKETLTSTPLFLPSKQVTALNLFSISELMLTLTRKKELLKSITVPQLVRMEEVLERMLAQIQGKISLATLSKNLGIQEASRAVIMGFLALLELIRLGSLDAEQANDGGDITIFKRENNSSMLK